MELETFIKETLLAIGRGVETAQNAPSIGATRIVPMRIDTIGGAHFPVDLDKRLQLVEFDVAGTVTDGANANAGGKISVLGGVLKAEASGGGAVQNTQITATRIKFTVPIALAGRM